MALLLGNIEADNIWLIGSWCSEKILQYLHVTVKPWSFLGITP